MITSAELNAEILPSVIRSLKDQRPLSTSQKRILSRMAGICSLLDEAGKTTAGAVLNDVLYPDSHNTQHRSTTAALHNLKGEINALFAQANKEVAMVIDPQRKLGHMRPVYFIKTEVAPTQTKRTGTNKPHALSSKEIVRALYIAMERRRPLVTKSVHSVSHTAFTIAALSHRRKYTTWGHVCDALYPDATASHEAIRTRISRKKRYINAFFQKANIPVALVFDPNYRKENDRVVYFFGTVPEQESSALSSRALPPKSLQDVPTAHQTFIGLYK